MGPSRLARPALLALISLAAALAVGLLAAAAARQEPVSAHSPPSLAFGGSGLYPRFDPDQRRYVARCADGGARLAVDAAPGTRVSVEGSRSRSGAFHARVAVPPGADFEILARSGPRTRAYTVRCLPAGFPDWDYEAGPHRVEQGLFVVTFPRRGSPPERPSPPWVVVIDQLGMPRWWFSPPTSAIGGQILRGGRVTWSRSFGDGYGVDPRMAHEVRSLSGELLRVIRTRGTITDSHEFEQLPNGNVLIDSFAPRAGLDLSRYENRRHPLPERATAVFPEVQEIDSAGNVVWRWNSHSHIDLGETPIRWRDSVRSNPHLGPDGSPTYDPFHINSVDPDGDQVVVSLRHTDAVYGIDHHSGEVLWKLGGKRTEDSLRVIGDPFAEQLFGGQHDARLSEDGMLSVYDNGKDRPRPPRAVWFDLDLENRTATLRRQLTDPRITSSHCCGSVRPFAGGWLVDWGRNRLLTAFDAAGRIAFRLDLPVSTYRAVPVPDGAVTPAELERGLEAQERSSR